MDLKKTLMNEAMKPRIMGAAALLAALAATACGSAASTNSTLAVASTPATAAAGTPAAAAPAPTTEGPGGPPLNVTPCPQNAPAGYDYGQGLTYVGACTTWQGQVQMEIQMAGGNPMQAAQGWCHDYILTTGGIQGVTDQLSQLDVACLAGIAAAGGPSAPVPTSGPDDPSNF